jgi:hypothetical protein
MAILVNTPEPTALLAAIKRAIDERSIVTWTYDGDGDFSHTPEQWKNKAWFRPKVETSRIVFQILTPRSTSMNRTVYAIYHGHFLEMLLTHFDERFTTAIASALPDHGDVVKA